MSQAFDTDVMDDLFYDAAEGPAQARHAADELDELDAGDDGFDELDEFDAFGEADGMDEFAEGGFDSGDLMDAMDDVVADALEAQDADEFLRRALSGLGRLARGAVNVARQVAPVVGQVARTVGPIASAIPLPWTQAIGRVANIAGRLMADEADEFEAIDEMIDLAEDEDAIDLAAPIISGITVRRLVPGVSRMPRGQRRALVRSVSRSARALGRRQGPRAMRATPPIVRAAQRTVQRRGQPRTALPRAVRRAAARVIQSPRLARRLAGTTPARRRRADRGRSFTLRGPVRIVIQGG